MKKSCEYFIVIDGKECPIAHAIWEKLWDDELVDHFSLIEIYDPNNDANTSYTVEWLGKDNG